MNTKPFLKWAGGKRWIVNRSEFVLPTASGRYVEPFLGGGAVFFHYRPSSSLLGDLNPRLIETYQAIKDDWQKVWRELEIYQRKHSREFYYQERSRQRKKPHTRAAQFVYLNRACWNGLYRVNLAGTFNVPIGTKSSIVFDDDDFEEISKALQGAMLRSTDFESLISEAGEGDVVFVDPPYTTAHNMNGFIKYNEKLFNWNDQKRLKSSCIKAANEGATVVISNADHPSIWELYSDSSEIRRITRGSVISGPSKGRGRTSELVIRIIV